MDGGPSVFVGPEGLRFSSDVTVTIPFDVRQYGGDFSDLRVFTRDSRGRVTLVTGEYDVDVEAGTVSFAVSHFSSFQAFQETVAPPPPVAGNEQFVGVWEAIYDLGGQEEKNENEEPPPVLTPAARQSVERQARLRAAGDITGDYSALCIPPAMPTMVSIDAHEILLDDEKFTWILEASSGIRWIWMDGRVHPPLEELRLTANGHSIGHWEGDVLVVDTIGFMDKAIVYLSLADIPGVFMYPSPQMHVVERMRAVEDGQAMISERTIDDPVNLEEPWGTTVRYERRDWEIEEMICAENNDFYFDGMKVE